MADCQLYKVSFPNNRSGKVIKWYVSAGDQVLKRQPLCIYEFTKNSKPEKSSADELSADIKFSRRELKAPLKSKVRQLVVGVGETSQPGSAVVILEEECLHSISVLGLCAHCGEDLTQTHFSETSLVSSAHEAAPSSTGKVAMVHGIPSLMVSRKHALLLGIEDEKRILEQKKLVLIVDLDQTLIHATVDQKVAKWLKSEQGAPLRNETFSFFLPGSPIEYFVKIRNDVGCLLKRLSKLYEFHIYTMGTRAYAKTVAKFIDPSGEYFSERILSRDDCYDKNFKTNALAGLFPHGDHMVVIIDDREDVWKFCKNLVKVMPYEFFAGAADVNALPMDQKPAAADESTALGGEKESVDDLLRVPQDDDYHIDDIADVLEKIHDIFYKTYNSGYPADVKNIIPAIKKSVLKGCHLVFSGVIPLNENPENSRVWKSAVEFGAKCYLEFDPQITTHLVASKAGTVKVMSAMASKNTYLVNVKWLVQSIGSYKRLEEFEYPLEPGMQVLCGSKNHIVMRGSSDQIEVNAQSQGLVEFRKGLSHEDLEAMSAEVDEFLTSGDEKLEDESNQNHDATSAPISLKRKFPASPGSDPSEQAGSVKDALEGSEDEDQMADWLENELLADMKKE